MSHPLPPLPDLVLADTANNYADKRNDRIEDLLFREDTFMTIKSRDVGTPLPPVTTSIDSDYILWRTKSNLPPLPGTPNVQHRKVAPYDPPPALSDPYFWERLWW